MSAPRKRTRKSADPLDADFGPGLAADAPAKEASRPATGPIPGIACAGDGCILKPAADLLAKFSLSRARGHGPSLARAAFSGIEFMKAMRDFLDEEIALAEGAAGRTGDSGARYEKIRVD